MPERGEGVCYSWGSEDLIDVKISLEWPYFTISPGANELNGILKPVTFALILALLRELTPNPWGVAGGGMAVWGMLGRLLHSMSAET